MYNNTPLSLLLKCSYWNYKMFQICEYFCNMHMYFIIFKLFLTSSAFFVKTCNKIKIWNYVKQRWDNYTMFHKKAEVYSWCALLVKIKKKAYINIGLETSCV